MTRRRFFDNAKPINTAPRDQGRLLMLTLRDGSRVSAYWWRHWSMADGCWWSPYFGAIDMDEATGWEEA